MLVAGVDGCPGGWLVVRARAAARLQAPHCSVEPTFEHVLAATRDCEAVAIDIPIGLTDVEPRLADIAARRVLGSRRNSVFPAPIRPVLEAASYSAARELCMRLRGISMSAQAFAIVPKIREVDVVMCRDRALQERVVEVHPEVSFWAINDRQPLVWSKRTPAGLSERLELLGRVYDGDLASLGRPRHCKTDDFYDACAAAWTAARFARREAGRLPAEPPTDSRGLRMEIVY